MGLATVLTERGIDLLIEGDQLIVESPTPLTDELRAFVRAHKQQLLDELRGNPAANDSGVMLYCAADLDLPMLPGNPGDAEFINKALEHCSSEWRHQLLTEYRAKWLTAAGSPELLEHQRDNAGRFAANTWLRTRLH
ncbi:TubC N-terminal docking domain-related protein [Marinobacterium weihaiense]|uniref:TubC N-terminal docking domain-containing protein n=1 Tax=Marinobacterium weihaiense TaxID=2851016 RepID=A0ABS6M6Y2_9GAMM|nr:hypothetical protein [Marinobacterium weihaiense]MBV0932032.1 hypothetical protein [Marinobacterium weihaiense]